jgi:hypothetical protein
MAGKLNIPPAIQVVGGIVLLGGAAAATIKIMRDRKKKKDLNVISQLQKTTTIKGINANGKPATINLATAASEIEDALFSNIYTEDEERAIRVFKSVPIKYIKQLGDVYQKVYNRNLQEDLRKYLSDEQFISIKYFFR